MSEAFTVVIMAWIRTSVAVIGLALFVSAQLMLLAPALGLSPHETLVLVNRDSAASLEVANHYCAARGIPLINRIDLALGSHATEPQSEIDVDGFRSLIWNPVQAYINKHGLEDHILAWVYSVDFPSRITTDPPMSLHGITLVRGEVPSTDIIARAGYISPFYAGPDQPGGKMLPTRSISRSYFMNLDDAPVPSFSLGHIGSRGLTPSLVISNLYRGVASDHTFPVDPVLFVTNDNIRSTCRAWQYPDVVQELETLGVEANHQNRYPEAGARVLGLLDGRAALPNLTGLHFSPGSIAEHLTSHGANFDSPYQTKLTAWLRLGVTASSGTVTEPYALWPKFLHARVFSHYARGCTILESYFQAVRCPLQIFLVGEPLAAPFAPDLPLTLQVNVTGDVAEVQIDHEFKEAPQSPVEYVVFLDGVPLEKGFARRPVQFHLSGLSAGYHELRVIGETATNVRNPAWAVAGFTVLSKEKGVAITMPDADVSFISGQTYPISFKTKGHPSMVRLMSGKRELDRTSANEGILKLDPGSLGLGPNRVWVLADYPEGEVVASKPQSIDVVRPAPPRIRFNSTAGDLRSQLKPLVESTSAQLSWNWFHGVGEDMEVSERVLTRADTFWRIDSSKEPELCRETLNSGTTPCGQIHAYLSFPVPRKGVLAGLAFNLRSKKDFDFFGMHGQDSAWVFATYCEGTVSVHDAVGRYIPTKVWTGLHVRKTRQGLEGLIDGEVLCRWPEGTLGKDGVAMMSRGGWLAFRDWMLESPELLAEKGLSTDAVCVAWDGYTFVEKPVRPEPVQEP